MKLFISYRSSNSDQVDRIVTRLRSLTNPDGSLRHSVWQDKDSIPGGKDWWEAIVDAISECEVFLFMVSREAVASANCLAELNYAYRRNRAIVPLVLQREYQYNTTTGKNDITYWNLIPRELTESRTQFIFDDGVDTYAQLNTAFAEIQRNPHQDIKRPFPPDPRPGAEENTDSSALFDQACDYAQRLDFDDAVRIFQRLMNAKDPDFGQDSREWIDILDDYAQMVHWDERPNTRYKIQALWTTYLNHFPKPFLERNFDPKGFQARFEGKTTLDSTATSSTAPPIPPSTSPVTEPPQAPPSGLPALDAKPGDEPQVTPPSKPAMVLTRMVGMGTEYQIMFNQTRPTAEREVIGQKYSTHDPRYGVTDFTLRLGEYWCKVLAGQQAAALDGTSTLPTFYIGKYLVTYKQYQDFIDDRQEGFSNPKWWAGLPDEAAAQQAVGPGEAIWTIDNHPREMVSWYDAIAFCRWLSAKLRYTVTLPTPEQWETAARGPGGSVYPWGPDFREGYANITVPVGGLGQASVVGIFPWGAAPCGALDMCGNLYEWCMPGDPKNLNPALADSVPTVRGGSWASLAAEATVHSHLRFPPDVRNDQIGFRLVYNPPVTQNP